MQTAMLFAISLFLGSLSSANAGAIASNVVGEHPVAKVITMIKGLKERAVREGKKEADTYSKFTYWCSTSLDEINDDIAEEVETLSTLKDTIRGQTKTQAALTGTIKDLSQDVQDMDSRETATKLARHNENKVFKNAYTEAAASLRAVHQATKATTTAAGQTSSLLQAFFESHAAKQTSLLDVTQELSKGARS